jgi:uncharacterized membrane protein YcaP (DUF421 family)
LEVRNIKRLFAMEPEVTAFLIKIVQSISMVMLWMLVNMTIGIYYGLAFVEYDITLRNVLYGIFLIASFVFLFIYLKRKWKDFKELTDHS